ncbi:ATP-binding protein [Pelobacter seleniigenes]|uniref:ATP-binding protein n=1 Tax=Pelobacter seleniigenes TaxID=407188 RepID=UPI0004A6FBA9|nr:ATP-binding protein [Pelobacter seleniigenes]
MRYLFRGIRSKFIIIYLLLGLAPLLLMSYHSSYVGAVSLENLSSQQMTNLTEKTASQVNQQLTNIYKDLDLLANYPFIQLAFLQFNFGQRLATVEQKLLRYKAQNPLYARISLITFDGELILTVPDDSSMQIYSKIDPIRLFKARGVDTFTSGVLLDHPEGPLLLFSKRIFDFEDSFRPVGHLTFYVKLDSLTRYIEELTPVPGTVGFVFDHALGQVISSGRLTKELRETIATEAEKRQAEKSFKVGENRFYWAHIDDLDWTIGLVMPEQALLGSITKLKFSSLAFSVLVAVMALLITLYLVRRITDPIAQLMRGAQEFSTGNLEHRIKIRGEGELRRLGEEYNAMASRLKARERQIIQVDRLASLGIMAAGIAHEVRNPLAGIKSCAQLMQRKAISNEVESLAQGINVEIDRLDQIVKHLLDFAKPGEAALQPVALGDLIDEIVIMVGKALDKQGVFIATDIHPVPDVLTDSGQVQQILLNLILNAAQSMANGGEVKIILQPEQDQVTLSVRDAGCGIAKDHLDRIFDPFFTTRLSGTGLGLSVVHSLMKQNNIRWNVTSKVDYGTQFDLYFPLPSQEV